MYAVNEQENTNRQLAIHFHPRNGSRNNTRIFLHMHVDYMMSSWRLHLLPCLMCLAGVKWSMPLLSGGQCWVLDTTRRWTLTPERPRGSLRHLMACCDLDLWPPESNQVISKVKNKGFPYSLPSNGPRADPVAQAVSTHVTVSHPPGGRLPLLSARPAVTFPAAEHHRPLAGTKLHCLVTEAHRCEQLAQGCYAAFAPSRIWTHDLLIASPTLYPLRHRATYPTIKIV